MCMVFNSVEKANCVCCAEARPPQFAPLAGSCSGKSEEQKPTPPVPSFTFGLPPTSTSGPASTFTFGSKSPSKEPKPSLSPLVPLKAQGSVSSLPHQNSSYSWNLLTLTLTFDLLPTVGRVQSVWSSIKTRPPPVSVVLRLDLQNSRLRLVLALGRLKRKPRLRRLRLLSASDSKPPQPQPPPSLLGPRNRPISRRNQVPLPSSLQRLKGTSLDWASISSIKCT
jgi:hypothetical protein